MKLSINKILYTFAAIALLASCKKDETKLVYANGVFADKALTSSATDLTLTKPTRNDTAVTFKWSKVDFDFKATKGYTLQFDKPSDTAGGWTHAKNVQTGDLALSYTVGDLNGILMGLGYDPEVKATLVVRVKGDAPQYNGAASSIPSAYTNVVVLNVTPYVPYPDFLYAPGAYQGWNPGGSQHIMPFNDTLSYIYEGYIFLPAKGNEFKFTDAPDWSHGIYGDGGGGSLVLSSNPNNMYLADSGYYEVIVNLKASTWKAIKTNWGIIGDARVGGDWNTDTDMTYDPATGLWTATLNMQTNGSYKFRANDGWSIDFGTDANGNMVYADNTVVYTPNTGNMSVATNGNYTITLDLRESGNYKYSVKKN